MKTMKRKMLIKIATWLDHMSWTDCDRAWWHTRAVCTWFYLRYIDFCERFDVESSEYTRCPSALCDCAGCVFGWD